MFYMLNQRSLEKISNDLLQNTQQRTTRPIDKYNNQE